MIPPPPYLVVVWQVAGQCWPGGHCSRSSKGEGVVGIQTDAHKLVTASAHGMICGFDMRTWRLLFSRRRPAAKAAPALTAVSFDGGWVVAGGGGLLHALVSRGELGGGSDR
tara:strand:+ start:340 stop:672 length:333 start_codon:yes stop_codon:yes gene_type:complete